MNVENSPASACCITGHWHVHCSAHYVLQKCTKCTSKQNVHFCALLTILFPQLVSLRSQCAQECTRVHKSAQCAPECYEKRDGCTPRLPYTDVVARPARPLATRSRLLLGLAASLSAVTVRVTAQSLTVTHRLEADLRTQAVE